VELGEEDRQRFRALGVLPPDEPFDLSLLAALWAADAGVDDEDCDALRLLSLIEYDADTSATYGGSWYRTHPLLRAYAGALLNDATERDEVFARYAEHMIPLAEQFHSLPPEEWARLTPLLPHVHAVGDELARCARTTEVATQVTERALRFASNITPYLAARREVRRIEWLEMGVTASRRVANEQLEGLFLNELGGVYSDLGEQQEALAYYQQALPLYRAVGDRGGEATALNGIGGVYSRLGEQQEALAYYQQALPLYRAVGDREGEAATLNNIGLAYSRLGDQQEALAYYQQALPLYRAVGDRGGEAATLNNIGMVYSALGEQQQALAYFQQALALSQAVGDRGGEATALNNIGMVYSRLGEQQEALAYFQQALPLRRALGDRGGEAATCFTIGMAHQALGNLDEAIQYVARCVRLDEEIGDPNLQSDRAALAELVRMRDGDAPQRSTLPADLIDVLVSNTIAVKTFATGRVEEWRDALRHFRDNAAGRGGEWVSEVHFAEALLAVLEDRPASLPVDNPYQPELQRVLDTIARERER
jgi:tetratricopeptide (TPR) repeat protein